MPTFFPRQTLEFRIEEPKAFRKISFSLVEMALITGVLLRIYRLFVLTHGSNNWFYLGGAFALGAIFLVGMLTAHLANYPLHQYLWRAPVFATVEVLGEMATSALLIALGVEPNGTVRAHWDDWIGMSLNALLIRGLSIVLWALALAAIVSLVRRTIVEEEEDDAEDLATAQRSGQSRHVRAWFT
jgi:hypothetical protein